MLEITRDTDVHAANGRHVGSVDRVVLDPITGAVTHLVVRKGLVLTEDRLIRTTDIATATDDRVTLREDVFTDDLLPFEEQHYVPVDGIDAAGSPRPGGLSFHSAWFGPVGIDKPMDDDIVRTVVERDIPDRLLALEAGAPVFSADRYELGRLDGVHLTEAGRPTHLVVKSGVMRPERRAVPISWVDDIAENAVALGTSRQMIDVITPIGVNGR